MANPGLGKSLCSDWFFLSQDFAVWTVSMETVQSVYFCLGAKPANSKFATKTAKKKCENCHSSHWNYQQKLKRLKFFRYFKHGWRRRTFFKCNPPEAHFTIRNRVPYNKLLTNWVYSGRTGEYWPSIVFVQISLRSVLTVTTSDQYSPARPSRSVSKRLILTAHSLPHRVRLWEEFATDEAVGMQRGYARIRSLLNRHLGRWICFVKDDSLCGVQNETPRFKRRGPI